MDASFYQGVAVATVAIAVTTIVQLVGTVITTRADRAARDADHKHRMAELEHQRKSELVVARVRERADAVERAIEAITHARSAIDGAGMLLLSPNAVIVPPDVVAALNKSQVRISLLFKGNPVVEQFARAGFSVQRVSQTTGTGISPERARKASEALDNLEVSLMSVLEFD